MKQPTLKKILYTLFLAIFCLTDSHAQVGKALPAPVNTLKYTESSPSVSADGRFLIFESDRQTDWKIFECRKLGGGGWSPPRPLDKITAFGKERATMPSVSYDGNLLLFSANFSGKGAGKEDLYFCTREKDDWSVPQNFGNLINTDAEELFPSLSANGKKLYFARGTSVQGKQGCYKIWVSERDDKGIWQSPTMLSNPVNFECETAPRIMADGHTLIFSSVRNGGKGNFDLYMSFNNEDGSWTTPVPYNFMNTSGNDQAVSVPLCGDILYYASNGDIYSTAIPSDLRPKRTNTIQGTITDSLTKNPLQATIKIIDQSSKENTGLLQSGADGKYVAVLPINGRFNFEIAKAGYKTELFSMGKLLNSDCDLVGRDVVLVPEKKKEEPKKPEEKPVFAPTLSVQVTEPQPQKPVKPEPKIIEVDLVALDAKSGTNIIAEFLVTENKSGKVVPLEKVPESLHAKVMLKAGEEYKIEAKSQGYSPISMVESVEDHGTGDAILRTVRMEQISSSFAAQFTEEGSVQPLKNVKVILTDMGNNLNIPVAFNLVKNNYTATLSPNIKYKVLAKCEGYEDFERAYNSSAAPTQVIYIALVKRKPAIAVFKATEGKSGKPVFAFFNVTSEKSAQNYKGKTDTQSEEFLVNLTNKDNESLTVEVTAEGFKTIQKNFTIDKPVSGNKYNYAIPLERAYFSLPIRVIDKATNQTVVFTELKITDSKADKPVDFKPDEKGQAVVNLKPDGRYVAEAKAKGYEDFREVINRFIDANELVLKLTKEAVQENNVVFSALDTVTNKPIDATFKVYSTKTRQSFSGHTSKDSPTYKLPVGGEDNLTVEVFALGYQLKSAKVSVTEKAGKIIQDIKLIRDFSILSIKALDAETGQKVETPYFNLMDLKSKQSVIATATSKQGIFSANVLPDKEYLLEIKANKYQTFEQKIKAEYDDKELEFKISPLKIVNVSVYALDELTKKTVPATFKITEVKSKTLVADGRTDIVKPRLPVTLIDKNDYTITVESAGYKLFEGKFTGDYAFMTGNNAALPFWMQKESYGFAFKTTDARTKQPIQVSSLRLLEEKTRKPISVSQSGPSDYFTELNADMICVLQVEADGYNPYEERIDPKEVASKGGFKKEINMTIKKKDEVVVAPVPEKPVATVKEEFDSGKKFVLNNVYFEQGSFILSPSSNADLDNLAQLMKENPKARLIIAGHTDNVGDARLNEYLSENRAKVIANYLMDKGILSTRLIPRGFGGSKPLAPNDNEENRKKNRRVEFMVL